MGRIKGLLVTVRTARQGEAMENGKFTPEYGAETATLSLCPADLAELGVQAGDKLKISSESGENRVTCRPTDGPKGIFFLPLGPTANSLIGLNTRGTGVPDFKNTTVVLETLD